MESCLTYLEGSRTRARYDADALHTLDPIDGAPLLARYDLTRVARSLNPRALAERSGPGMWRWSELLPVRDRRHVIHLGEGSTPLLPAARMGAALGVDGLLVKAEGLNPTGSFKARGMAAAVSRARELGVRALIAPSAGNAGGALAAYGAAAGIPVTVVMPADTPDVNVVEAQMLGATVILAEGVITDCGRLTRAITARTGAFDVSTLKEPYRVEGKKTMGLELVEQLGWAVPDVIVYPTGGGTGLVGMWKAFDELESLGMIGSARPRMVAAQAEGCAPIVRAFRNGDETATPWEDPATRASGLRVPSAVGDRLILSALRDSDGAAVAVPETEIDAIQRLAGRRGVGYVSPESATAFAAVAALADEGWVAANERVVVFDCGVGLKYPPPPLQRPPVVDPAIADDPEAVRRLLIGLSGRAGSPSGAGRLPPTGVGSPRVAEDAPAPSAGEARPEADAASVPVEPAAVPEPSAPQPAPPSAPPSAPAPVAPTPVRRSVRTSTTTPVSALATLMARRRAERRLAEAEAMADARMVAREQQKAADAAPTDEAATSDVVEDLPAPADVVGEEAPADMTAPADLHRSRALVPGAASSPMVPGQSAEAPDVPPSAPRVPGEGIAAPPQRPPAEPVAAGAPAPQVAVADAGPTGPVMETTVFPMDQVSVAVPPGDAPPSEAPAPADGPAEPAPQPDSPPDPPADPIAVTAAPPDPPANATADPVAAVGPLPKPPHREIIVRSLPDPPRAA